MTSRIIHEKGCWSGFVEDWVVGHSPSYAPEFDDEVCIECQVICGELIPHPPTIPTCLLRLLL